ncbi:MAG TPA: SRPBCC family protein [Acidimicrobiales bacterium]|nr:SRPBCC family protein [Acidimicrobiales bacterium]
MADATFTVERSARVGAPPERVYAAIADFHDWRNWSPWEDVDPDLQRAYSGADEGIGAVYEWKGNRKAGEGRMEITEAEAPSRVRIALDFLKPFRSSNVTTFYLNPADGGTEVRWTMVGPKTLGTRIMGIFKSMDSLVGKDFEKGLRQLDAHVSS